MVIGKNVKNPKGKWVTTGLLGFVFGLVLFAVFDKFSFFGLIAGLLFLIVLYVYHAPKRGLLSFLLMSLCLGYVAADWRVMHAAPPLSEQAVVIEGVVKRVQLSDKVRLTVNTLFIDGEQVQGAMYVYAPIYPKLEYGTTIRFACEVIPPAPIEEFRYDRFLAAQGIVGSCFLKESPFVIASAKPNAQTLIHTLRAMAINRLNRVFGEPHASLVAGLYFGEQRFSEEWAERFRITGTTHVVAASGYNVSLVASLLFTFAVAIGLWRKQAFFLILVGIVVYAIVAGLDPPIIRASIMGALVLLAKQLGRKSRMDNVLLLTFAIMLVQEPRLVVDHIGFQLSAISTLALIYLAPKLENAFRFVPETIGLREGFTATVTATIATLPFTLFTFGAFSLIAPIANLFLLPFLPYVMLFSAPALLLPSGIAVLFVFPATLTMNMLFLGLRALASLSFAYREVSPSVLAILVCCIVILCLHVWKSKRKN